MSAPISNDTPVGAAGSAAGSVAGSVPGAGPGALTPSGQPILQEANPSIRERLGDWMVTQGLITPDQLQVALKEQKRTRKLLGELMVELGFISEATLGSVLAESAGLDRVDLKHTMLDPDLVRMIPREAALRHKVILLALTDQQVRLAMADVYDVMAIDQARRYLPRGLDVVPVVASETDLIEAIDTYYGYEMTVDGLLRELETGVQARASEGDEGLFSPTVRLVNAIVLDALKTGASDIHLEPEALFVRLRYRIDGALQQIRTFHKDYWPAICVRAKIMAGMNIAETRNPQDGRFSFTVSGREVDFRCAVHPTVHGENIVIRILDKSRSLVPLDRLGYASETVDLVKKQLMRPEGIIIVTGPTGSGKTTTLYSMLEYVNSSTVNIMTLEEPVEYQLPLIRQSDIKDGGATMGFADGIRSIMRQDPDIVFVGEVRDEKTAQMALRAAMTGHQVFTTLHTNDALGAVSRLLDLELTGPMLAGNIIAIMAQRLVRKLCTHCAASYQADAEECRVLRCDPANPPTIKRPMGCEVCRGTGFKGRTALVEVLGFDSALDDLLAEGASRGQMLRHARARGFIPMQEDGVRKVLAGETSLSELIRSVNMIDRL